MKTLQIIPTLQKGGAERLCLDICNTLQKKESHQVQLINFHPKNDYPFLTENIDRNSAKYSGRCFEKEEARP